ncbi:MAG: GNAT family N-acetyltransferase [Candidatus Limnocylindrales bacterium]
MGSIRIVDVADEPAFRLIPPCADPSFDHRSCDYWENAESGSKAPRSGWLEAHPASAPARISTVTENPFAPAARPEAPNPFAADAPALTLEANPFAPRRTVVRPRRDGLPRKLALLDRGRGLFGSYAKVLLDDDAPAAYCQFGPISAYPRAQRLRDLYPQLPASPLPAVVTCIASSAAARGRGYARRLAEAVCEDLRERGFSAVEAYPDLARGPDATSGASPVFWEGIGFALAVADARFPVMRREL